MSHPPGCNYAAQVLLTAVVWLTLPPATVVAATFYIDASQSDVSQCGTATDRACRTYRYWFDSGCDTNGCGNNVTPGDTLYFRSGTYTGDGAGGYVGIPFNGTASAPVTVACLDAPGSCIFSGAGVNPIQWCGLVGVGLAPGRGYCAADVAEYVQVKGFRVQQIPSGMYGLTVTSPSHHVAVVDVTIDGSGADRSLFLVASGTNHVTLRDSTLTQCPASDTGCTYIDTATNVALVGNSFGPVASSGNFDCNTLLGVSTALVDGNTCRSSADGFDGGMRSASRLDNVIVRYNRVSGATSRAFPLSGDRKDSGVNTGKNILYKNVAQPNTEGRTGRCVELYEGAERIDLWYNTCFASDDAGWGDVLWLNARGDYSSYLVQNVRVKYNLFDTRSTQSSALIVLDQDSGTVSGCPSSAPCPFTGNGLWMAERGGGAACAYWDPSETPQASFTCAQFGGAFNSGVHSGNFRADPAFRDRSQPQTLENLQLTTASTSYIDKGKSFCRAVSAGSGTSVSVACDGVTPDPRHYFPDPAALYALANADCKGRGVRAADGVDPGCFDVQIEGPCGVREILAMTATSLTFGGAPCSWASGAMVHLPWNGPAPDVGALELAPTRPEAPELRSVQPLP